MAGVADTHDAAVFFPREDPRMVDSTKNWWTAPITDAPG
jgi:hypothetical protein